MTIQLSVLVAIKDVAQFLPQCLESLHTQTLQEAEFILVDDGSRDHSRQICEEYVRKDPRFQIIVHEKNQGCVVTRADAIERASGEFAIILDGDDYILDATSLAELAEIARRENVDILRYSADTRTIDGQIDEGWQRVFARQGEPKEGAAEILKQLYMDHAYPYSIICVCYRMAVLKRMLTYVKREFLVVSEDAYQHFLIASLSQSYKGVRTRPFYQYRVGSGVSTGTSTMPKFRQYLLGAQVPQWLREFLQVHPIESGVADACIRSLEDSLMESLVVKFQELPDAEKPEAFALVAQGTNAALFYQHLQAQGPSNRELYRVPAKRLFRAWIKALLGKTK